MKSSSVILFVIGLLLLLGLYILMDDRFSKLDARLQGAEAALDTLEPLRSVLAAGSARPPVEDPYLPVQATGPPNTAAAGRDSPLAWCPAEADAGEEWLLLEYERGLTASAVRVVANFNPGAVTRLAAVADDGSETELWRGPAAGDAAGMEQQLQLPAPQSISRLRVTLDTAVVEGWNEIDAVGLVGPDGNAHWATTAEASSSWTPKPPQEPGQGR